MFRKRNKVPQPQSALADIAMLLLIFFLVTTQMEDEQGVTALLPPKEAVKSGRPLTQVQILLNQQDQVQINSKRISLGEIDTKLYKLLVGNGQIQVELRSHVQTSYPAYVKAYDEIKSAYKMVYNDMAEKEFQVEFNQLSPNQKKQITSSRPIKIFEGDLVD